jgi:hypothetical protein
VPHVWKGRAVVRGRRAISFEQGGRDFERERLEGGIFWLWVIEPKTGRRLG